MKSRTRRDHSQLTRRLEIVIALSLCVALLGAVGALAYVSLWRTPSHPLLYCVAVTGRIIVCTDVPPPPEMLEGSHGLSPQIEYK